MKYYDNKILYENLPCIVMSGVESDGITESSDCFI